MNDKRGYDAALQCHAGMAGGDLSQSDDVLELEQLANSLKQEAKVLPPPSLPLSLYVCPQLTSVLSR